jgi:GT2 family glycosyltransferase
MPMARNRVLAEALALNADWLAYIDDDQIAWPDWIEKHLAVAARDQAEVVTPYVIVHYPQPLPFWCFGETAEYKGGQDAPLERRLRDRADRRFEFASG